MESQCKSDDNVCKDNVNKRRDAYNKMLANNKHRDAYNNNKLDKEVEKEIQKKSLRCDE